MNPGRKLDALVAEKIFGITMPEIPTELAMNLDHFICLASLKIGRSKL